MKKCMRVAVTGGLGQIAYQFLFRIASGELFGRSQPISLHILERERQLPKCEGVKMELQDCAFPLLHDIEITSDPHVCFSGANIAILIGAKPRKKGMERKELLMSNGKIFIEQGQALNENADPDVKVFVVGNPCNTNCLIAMHNAPRLKRKNFYAMTRLDQNRAVFFIAEKAGVPVRDVSHMVVWGNHSSTQVPDFCHAKIKKEPLENVITDREWLEKTFLKAIQQRGAAVIAARGKSSAGSATQAIVDSIQDIHFSDRSAENWFSIACDSSSNPYAIEEDLVFSFPCQLNEKGEVKIVRGLIHNEFIAAKLKLTERELLEERDLVREYLKL